MNVKLYHILAVLCIGVFLAGVALCIASEKPVAAGILDQPPATKASVGESVAQTPAATQATTDAVYTLTVSITADPVYLNWGDRVTYTIVMRNTGGAVAAGARMTNTLPNGLTYISGTLHADAGVAEYSFTENTIRWQGDLTATVPVTVTYVAQLVTLDYIQNNVTLGHPQAAAEAKAASSPPDRWGAPEVVVVGREFDKDLVSRRHLAVDSQGRPRVAYGAHDGLYYATFENGAWISARVPVTPSMPSKATLALDAQDRAYIAFYDVRGHIWLAREISPTANIWSLESVTPKDFGSNSLERADLQLGSDGRPHLVYYDTDTPSGYYYTVYSGTTWLTPTLATDSTTCSPLALDASNTPHLVCVTYFGYDLTLFTYNGATWSTERIERVFSDDRKFLAPSLVYSGTQPHVAFARWNNGLYHAVKDGGWTMAQVDAFPWTGQYEYTPQSSAIEMRNGMLAVAYAWYYGPAGSSTYTESLRWAARPLTGTTWVTETVDTIVDVSYSTGWAKPALALDAAGHGHLTYYDNPAQAFRHAAQTHSFTLYTIDESVALGDNSALAVGRDGSVHVAYVANNSLRYAYSLSNTITWTQELIAPLTPPGASQALLDIAVDAAAAPHLVYQDGSAQPLYHAVKAGTTWTTRAVDTPGDWSYPALDADAAGTANVAYMAVEGANLAVRHAAFNGTGWTTETLAVVGPNAPNHWQLPKIVAQGGQVHVLYADCTAFQASGNYPITLTLKTLSGGAWRAQTVYTFTGQCNWNLDYRLLGDGAEELTALLTWQNATGVHEQIFWLAADGALGLNQSAVAEQATAPQAPALRPAGIQPQGSLVDYLWLWRGLGLEKLTTEDGDKYATYTDRDGYTTPAYQVGQTLDSYTYLYDADRYGQTGALLERSYSQNALAVERTVPQPQPTTWANATKSATPAEVYAYERITYTIRLYWQGNKEAAITLSNPLWMGGAKAFYVDGTLRWGAYIERCTYEDMEIKCYGAFPASQSVLETSVTFAVMPTCRAYEDGKYSSLTFVSIGGYDFKPLTNTPLKAPFRLRASTPRFIPQQRFAPGHTVLLYTVPKGDEPPLLLQDCKFNPHLTMHPGNIRIDLRDDGQFEDFYANDLHYSAWVNPTMTNIYKYDLYVGLAGSPMYAMILADTLSLPYTWPEDPHLAVLTDFQALFTEWMDIGQHYPAEEQDAPIKDQNANRILDYYDAVERIRQYAANENGVVIDVARDAYDEITRLTGFYPIISDFRFTNRVSMGDQIDSMIYKLPRTIQNIAILGNDAVVPYARLGVTGEKVRESYPFPRLGPYSVTSEDRYMTDLSQYGVWLSDIPYGTWSTGRPTTPRLELGVGRVFRDMPLDFIALLDKMEQPLVVGRASRVWVMNQSQSPDDYRDYSQEARDVILPPLERYLPRVTRVSYHPGGYTGAYPAGVYWLDGDVLLQPDQQRWNAADAQAVKNQGQILIFIGLGSERGIETGDIYQRVNRPVLANGQFGLALAAADYSGLVPAGRDATEWDSAWFGNAALDANAPLLAGTARMIRRYSLAASWVNQKLLLPDAGYTVMYPRFLDNLFYNWDRTLGQAQVDAHNYYAATRSSWPPEAMHTQALYTLNLNGLPTQPIERSGKQATVTRLAAAPARASIQAAQAAHTFTRTVTLAQFVPITDTQGRVAFGLPHNGALTGETDGPVLPVVRHTYVLPADATDIQVTLTFSQGHAVGPLTPIPLTLLDAAGQPAPGVFTPTNPYPAAILSHDIYTHSNRLYLNVALIPQQYNPETRMATLYDRLDYQITYTAPDTHTLGGLLVNGGVPVAVDQPALPLTVTLNAGQAVSGTVYWAIVDVAGQTLDGGAAPISVTAGVYQIGLASDTLGWDPGPKQFVVFLAAEQDGAEVAVAGGHTLFTVSGRSLDLTLDQKVYGADDATATLAATVRDETGAGVPGLAGNLAARLDGAPLAPGWQGSGVYTAALNLGGLVAGQHFISVTLEGRVAEDAFIVDRQPPTSTVSAPAIVYSPTFTVTLSGGDDLSGVAAYTVQYRVGTGGTWTDWLTRPTGWDYTTGSRAGLTLTFGPTQPVALQPGQTVYLRTRAVDLAGNWEAEHAAPDAAVKYEGTRYLYLPLVLRNR